MTTTIHMPDAHGAALRRLALLLTLEVDEGPTFAGAAAELDAIALRQVVERALEPGDLELLVDVADALNVPAAREGKEIATPNARPWVVT